MPDLSAVLSFGSTLTLGPASLTVSPGKTHRVLLSDIAVSLLRESQVLADESTGAMAGQVPGGRQPYIAILEAKVLRHGGFCR
jgi:hypothetical protein